MQTFEINLYMNTGISNLHICCIDLTKMRVLTLFQFDTQLPTSKHPKLFSTYLVERNVDMYVRDFQVLKIRKMNISWNIKIKYVTVVILRVGSSSMKYYT